ncbi:PREDICTED: slit homolog 1 protein-like [Polistes dominula]|uniref:Slit homolog 1 protein-like n=1 Tax=Polistes dominula TaxID=743375 RepID=A0ABM1HV87_POLDO|nr:PREDICTED: slit homolog 1 protein-like [Polistes dominula]
MTCRIIASSRFFAILGLIIIILFSFVLADYSCSVLCDCDNWYGLKRARCVGQRIYSIHTGAPNFIQALDLSNNSISSLGNNELADAGLTNLKYLNLSLNAISDISLEAFSRITKLTVLDLSRNHLYHLLPDIFLENKNLRVLKLSRNNFNTHVPKLQCPWLTELDVHSCQISHIPLDTFVGLTHLRYLDLTNNLMIQLDNAVLEPLQFLRKLSLEGNPWSCNGIIYELENNLRSRHVEYDPICNKTTTLGPKKFEKMILKPLIDSKIRTHSSKDYVRFEESPKCNNDIQNSSNTSTINDLQMTYKKYSSMTPYWFLIMGFLLGCATGILICYLYSLKKFIYCCRDNNYRAHTTYDDSQRLFLLHNQWHVAAATGPTLNSSQTISCPGTPPPPYRDVMLRPGLYRAATPI